MRKVLEKIAAAAQGAAAGASSAQGAAGVAAVAGGCWLEFGEGWALITGGGFLLLGAWGRR